MSQLREIPSPPGHFLLGNLPEVMGGKGMGPTETLMHLGVKYAPLFQLKMPGGRVVIASGHSVMDEICDESRFDKAVKYELEVVRDLAGDGLFTANTQDPNWKKAHNILMPSFSAKNMHEYLPTMDEVARALVERWTAAEKAGSPVDVGHDMTRLTFEVIGRCGFSQSFDCFRQEEPHPFIAQMVRCLGQLSQRAMTPNFVNALLFSRQQQWEKDIQSMNTLVDGCIARRRQEGAGSHHDLLQTMLSKADKETGQTLDDVNIRFQALTFLVAGHETTSGLLSFALYFLVNNPPVLARVQQEVDEVLADDPVPVSWEAAKKLTYLMRVLKESLRLWPPAPGFMVYAKEDTVLAGGYGLKKGEVVAVNTPALHRDPAVWGPQPEVFDPDRFLPEREAQIPVNAYKPFGNGQRACIGREFALQEAQLALALVLRKFQPIDHTHYQLKIQDTVTIKPEGFTLKLKARQTGQASHGTPLLVLYGSNMGTCEEFARQLAEGATSAGYQVRLAALDEVLPEEGTLLVVTSSYNGTPPDNARKFMQWLAGAPALKGLRFAVFGCGNHEWSATYQKVPREIDARLAELGATRLLPLAEGDVARDAEADFRRWYGGLWPVLGEALHVTAGPSVRSFDAYQVEVLEEQSPNPFAATFSAQPMTVVENRELVQGGSRSVRHLELALPPGVDYQAGDHLGVLGRNGPHSVARAAARFALSPQTRVKLSGRGPLPRDRVVSVETLLGDYLEIQEAATRTQLEVLADHTPCPRTQAELRALLADADRYRTDVLGMNRSLIDFLEEYPASSLPFAVYLELVSPLKPRYYSISSSPRCGGRILSLTVGVVSGPARRGYGDYVGVCSPHLANLRKGQSVSAFVHDTHSTFRLPPSPRTPVIMVGPGTGLAPFRGFLQERQAWTGVPVGPAMLFFGCRRPDEDYLYADELQAFAKAGLCELHVAFSRNGPRVYVQDLVREQQARVRELVEQGAAIYVCGDGSRMAPDVRQAFAQALGSDDRVQELMASGRYLLDVWASHV